MKIHEVAYSIDSMEARQLFALYMQAVCDINGPHLAKLASQVCPTGTTSGLPAPCLIPRRCHSDVGHRTKPSSVYNIAS